MRPILEQEAMKVREKFAGDILEQSAQTGDDLAPLIDTDWTNSNKEEAEERDTNPESWKINAFDFAARSAQKQNKSNDAGFLRSLKHVASLECIRLSSVQRLVAMPESLSNLKLFTTRKAESDIQTEGKDSLTAHTDAIKYGKIYRGQPFCGLNQDLRLLKRWIYGRTLTLDVKNPEENRGDEKSIVRSSGLFLDCLRAPDGKQTGKVRVCEALVEAMCRGNFEFITKANPEFLWDDDIARQVFEVAIELREAKVFSLIYELPNKVAIASYVDSSKNNLLHKAALVAHPMVLNRITGPALQMQRELQWFKEVETLVSPAAREWKNAEHLKPRALFTESHKDLVIEGEKWMKETSSSCIVVAALIVSLAFASAFSVPRGNNQDADYRMFSKPELFKIFVISDSIALFSSTTSVLIFLGILTSRYAEEDFLASLPTKLIAGLSTLFLSVAALTIAISAGLAAVYPLESWIVIPTICIVNIPVAVFVRLRFPLLVNSFAVTCGPSIFFKCVKHWIYGSDS